MAATNNAVNSNNDGSANRQQQHQYQEVSENQQSSALETTSYQKEGEEVAGNPGSDYVTLKGTSVGGDTGGEKVIVLMKNEGTTLSPSIPLGGMMAGTTLGSPLNPIPGISGMGASMTAPVFDSCIVPVNVCNSNNMMGGYGHSSMYGVGSSLSFTPATQFPTMNPMTGYVYGK
jgi:hypothetical protein